MIVAWRPVLDSIPERQSAESSTVVGESRQLRYPRLIFPGKPRLKSE